MAQSRFNIILVTVLLFAGSESKCIHSAFMEYCEGESGKFLAHDRAFEIASLYIESSDLTNLSEKDFSSFQYLETLTVDNCTFPMAKGCTFFTPLKRLRRLSITNSDIGKDCVLSINTTNLRELSLQANKISHLRSEFFTQLKHVEVIDLSYNNISDIAPDTFSNLTSLKRVNLENNRIGEGFDPLFLSLAPSVCSLCDGVRRKNCSEGCRGNAEVDVLWRSLEGLEVDLTGNPICGKVVDDTVLLHGRQNKVALDQEADWDGSCLLLRPGRCPVHEKRNFFLREACFSGKSTESKTVTPLHQGHALLDHEEVLSPTAAVPEQPKDDVDELRWAEVKAQGTGTKAREGVPWTTWVISSLTFVVGVLVTAILFVWKCSKENEVSQSGVGVTAEEGESHPLNEVRTEVMSQDVSVGITPAAAHARRYLR